MTKLLTLVVAALVGAMPGSAQQGGVTLAGSAKDSTADSTAATTAPKKAPRKAPRYEAPAIEIQHIRPIDQRGINVYESPKEAQVPFTGFKLTWGGAFTQQFQNLTHENTAAPRIVNGADQNTLIPIGSGVNHADATPYPNVPLPPG